MNILVHESDRIQTFSSQEEFSNYRKDKLLIEAAGGIVFNELGQLLMIFRRGHWDLPKGKLDPGETLEKCAIREVKEETGLTAIEINKFFTTTYHLYEQNGHIILKPSHWFLMDHRGEEKCIPQIEEEITQIKWFNTSELKEISQNCFGTIKEILDKLML